MTSTLCARRHASFRYPKRKQRARLLVKRSQESRRNIDSLSSRDLPPTNDLRQPIPVACLGDCRSSPRNPFYLRAVIASIHALRASAPLPLTDVKRMPASPRESAQATSPRARITELIPSG